MKNTMLNETQIKLLEMMEWFHQTCVEHGLKYYCLGGTMLGAVRHEGFIPWDDDIDVGLPRQDYEKLLLLLGGRIIDGYCLESYQQGNKDFAYSYAKLYDTKTTLIESTRYNIKRGIYLDVFPLDGMGNTEQEAKDNYKKLLPLLNLLAARSCAIRKGRKIYKNLSIIFARMIPGCILSEHKLIKKINYIAKTRNYYESKYIGNIDGNWREKEIMERSIFGSPRIYSFNGLDVYGVSDYESYLTHMYGDWRKLPPVDKRITHHEYVKKDLHKSYLKI